jgi:hypothetical protein
MIGEKMSHFSRLKTQMVEKEYLLKALDDLGYSPEETNATVSGFQGEQTPVDIRIPMKIGYDIGFRKVRDRYEIIADWWGVVGLKQKEFTNTLLQRYAYHATLAKLESQGFTLVSEETGDRDQIRLVLRRLA